MLNFYDQDGGDESAESKLSKQQGERSKSIEIGVSCKNKLNKPSKARDFVPKFYIKRSEERLLTKDSIEN